MYISVLIGFLTAGNDLVVLHTTVQTVNEVPGAITPLSSMEHNNPLNLIDLPHCSVGILDLIDENLNFSNGK